MSRIVRVRGCYSSARYFPRTRTMSVPVFASRNYQVELLEVALKSNTIVCLGTGTGKTFIAVLLIKEFAHTVVKPISEGGQRIVFIVPSVALVEQQANNVSRHTSLKVGKYVGSMCVDSWDKKLWETELKSNEVVVMTAQILVNILNSGFVRLKDFSLLVMDECHHAVKNDPFSQVMDCFRTCPEAEHPHILGLTASILAGKCKCHEMEAKIKNLEVKLRSRCATTRDLVSVREYGTQPKEELLPYNSEEVILDETVTVLSKCESLLKCAVDEGIAPMILKPLKKLMSDCSHVLCQLGQWAMHFKANAICEYIEQLKNEGLIDSDDTCTKVLTVCENELKKSLEQCQQVTPPRCCLYIDDMFVSHKAATLLSYIKKVGCDEATEDNLFCAIVFVERRSTAQLLCKLIARSAESDPDLAFVKPLWTVGAGGISLPSVASSETGASHSKQKLVLEKFRLKQCNLLVSTSATEEGLDIPSCSLVIQFDQLKEVRAYIQAKGRARRKDSKFAVLVEQSDMDLVSIQLKEFRAIEDKLAYMCIDRTMPSEEEVEERLTNLPDYSTGIGARVTMASSIELVNRYCDKLPGDHFTRLAPHCKVIDADEGGFIAELALPRNSPFKESLRGGVWPSKMRAKQHVALLMCEQLHKMQQLDDHLCPIVDDESDTEDSTDDDTSRGVSGDNKKFYEMKFMNRFLKVLKDCRPWSDGPLYLYRIDINPVEQPKSFLSSCCCCLGILTAKRLPALPIFSLYPKTGVVLVSFQPLPLDQMSRSLMDNIDCWHERLFKHIVDVGNSPSLQFDPLDTHRAYRIVPLSITSTRPWTIDRQLLSLRSDPTGLQSQRRSSIGKDEMVGRVVTKTYVVNKKQQFRVIAVRHDLKPSSEFPDGRKATTYAGYYEERYGLKIKDMQQPLLEVEELSRKSNALVKAETGSRNTNRLQLVPELCDVDELPADVWDAGLLIGSVLWRFEQLLVVRELRLAIATQTVPAFDNIQSFARQVKESERSGMSSPPAKKKRLVVGYEGGMASSAYCKKGTSKAGDDWVSTDTCTAPGQLLEEQEPEYNSMPSLFEILTAVTAKSCADSFNLERLETLGDCFLKLAVSMSVFWEHINKHEGQLSKKRSRLVSNANLFSLARKKNLPAYMFVTAFKPSAMWLPPGFRHMPSAESGECAQRVQASYRAQMMSDKRVADAVEALIGAYLVHGSYLSALQFMKWIGIPVAPPVSVAVALGSGTEKKEVERCIDIIASASFSQGRPLCNQRSVSVGSLCAKLINLERSIGYEFRDKRWLLQALTHPSFHWNCVTDSYQRMEFLGDAIIDFLVTRTIFANYPDLDPGKLTDVRAALVCNDTFAKIALERGYHRHLNALSPRLFRAIDLYARSHEEKPSTDPVASLTEIVDNEDEEEVEAPKILGDLFESVAGAIFLDSGLDMEELWTVYLAMLFPYIEKHGMDPPIQPVRQLYEMVPFGLQFSKPVKELDGRTTCTVTLLSGVSFTASARNRKLARIGAAKKAVRSMKK